MRPPSALTPSVVIFSPWPDASIFSALLRGAGPGLNLDFATLSFHVPILGSRAWAARFATSVARAVPRARATPSVNVRQGECIVPLLPTSELQRDVVG